MQCNDRRRGEPDQWLKTQKDFSFSCIIVVYYFCSIRLSSPSSKIVSTFIMRLLISWFPFSNSTWGLLIWPTTMLKNFNSVFFISFWKLVEEEIYSQVCATRRVPSCRYSRELRVDRKCFPWNVSHRGLENRCSRLLIFHQSYTKSFNAIRGCQSMMWHWAFMREAFSRDIIVAHAPLNYFPSCCTIKLH